jgi:hypothetical protein
MRRISIAISLTFFLTTPVLAHDFITQEIADGYVKKIQDARETTKVSGSESERSHAYLTIGKLLVELKSFFNRDIATHGEVNGLATKYLFATLDDSGLDLKFSKRKNFYEFDPSFFEKAIRGELDSGVKTIALGELIKGNFYQSFDGDFLETRLPSEKLKEDAERFEKLTGMQISESIDEELLFIGFILNARVAIHKGDQAMRVKARKKALELGVEFRGRFPDSLSITALDLVETRLNSSK